MSRQAEELADATVRAVGALSVRNTPSIRAIRRTLSAALKGAKPDTTLDLAQALIARGLRWVGYEIITHHPPTMASLNCRGVESLGRGIASWSDVDTFAMYVSGPALRDGRIAMTDVVRWARSSDVWWRRAALVSTVPLNTKAAGGDANRTLRIARLLIDDREDMVVKALSWALRALAMRDPNSVRRFLKLHKSRLAARVIRETQTKLKTGVKQRRRTTT